MIKEYGCGFNVDVETLVKIDSIFLDNIVVEKLRERGSSWNQQGDNLHGSFDKGKSLSFESTRGVWKKLSRFSPWCCSKLLLRSSMTMSGSFKKITLMGSVKNKYDFLEL